MPIRSWAASLDPLKRHWLSVRYAGLSSHERKRHWDRVLAGPLIWWVVLWAAWAIRLWHLDASDLTFDEAATYFVAFRPLPDILAYLRQAVREHPPVYYMLIRPWMSLAGTSEYSLRFFAVGASLLGTALTARLARMMARPLGMTRTGELFVFTSLPALILALFPVEVYYARDARMYTLTIVWATLSSLLFLPLVFDGKRGPPGQVWPSRPALVGLVFVNALALFTHYYLAFLIVTQFVSLLLLRRWRALVAWCTAHGLLGLMGLIWLARSPGLSSSLSEAWGRFVPTWPTLGQLRRLLADLLLGPITGVPWSLVYGCGALVALGLLAAWVHPARALRVASNAQTKDRRSPVLGLWLTLTVLLPVALAYVMPEPPRSRFLIFLLPFAALALGQIPFLLPRRAPVVIWLGLSALAVTALGIYGLPRTVKWIKSNYGHTIATVSAHARPGDGVLFYGPWQEIQYRYYHADNFPPISRVPSHAPPQLVPEKAEPVLRDLLETHQRLWVIPAAVNDVDPAHYVDGWLNTHAYPVWTTHDLSLYLPPAEQDALSLPVDIPFGDRLRLERVSSDAQAVPAGEGLRLTLTWAVSATLDGDVKLDLSLVDQTNNRWQQWESVPGQWSNPSSNWRPGDEITDHQGLVVPQGAPPGIYTVQLAVIDVDSTLPLGPFGNPDILQPRVDLFSFEVTEPVAPPVLLDVSEFAGPFAFESPQGTNQVLTLVGYELAEGRYQRGNSIPLRLHWLAPSQSAQNLTLRFELSHRSRKGLFGSQVTLVASETLPLSPDYPISVWSPGRLVSLPTALFIPFDAAPGSAQVTLTVLGSDDQPWMVGGSQRLTLGELTLEKRPILRELPSDLTAVQVDFADQTGNTADRIGLRGYRIDGEAGPGGQLELTYAWYGLSHPERIYSVFNHLLAADGQRVAQIDGWPQGGALLTSQWQPGDYIRDSHTLEIPADASTGPYTLLVGLYDAATGDRLQASIDGQPFIVDQWELSIGGGQVEPSQD